MCCCVVSACLELLRTVMSLELIDYSKYYFVRSLEEEATSDYRFFDLFAMKLDFYNIFVCIQGRRGSIFYRPGTFPSMKRKDS